MSVALSGLSVLARLRRYLAPSGLNNGCRSFRAPFFRAFSAGRVYYQGRSANNFLFKWR